MSTIVTEFQRIKSVFFKALGAAIVLKILFLSPLLFVVSLLVFICLLDITLTKLEEDSATKRLSKKIWWFGVGLGIFVGFRIVLGHYCDMPFVNAYNSLEGVNGIIGLPMAKDIPQALIFELSFLIPGAGLAYAIIKGGPKTHKVLYSISVLFFIFVLWQTKFPEDVKNTKRLLTAYHLLSRKNAREKAMDYELENIMTMYRAIQDIKISRDEFISKGTKVVAWQHAIKGSSKYNVVGLGKNGKTQIDEQMLQGDKEYIKIGSELFIAITPPNENSTYTQEEPLLVPLRMLSKLSSVKNSPKVGLKISKTTEMIPWGVSTEIEPIVWAHNGDKFIYESSKPFWIVNENGQEFSHQASAPGEKRFFYFYDIPPQGENVFIVGKENFQMQFKIDTSRRS